MTDSPVAEPQHGVSLSDRQTHAPDYPTVAAWLDKAKSGHIWKQLLDTERLRGVTPPTMADMILKPLDLMAEIVEAAHPVGLSDFIRIRFCDADPINTLSARLELLCAFFLAATGIPFGFGGKGEADLCWHQGTDQEGWLELTRSSLDDFDRLRNALDSEVMAKDVVLRFHLDEWPLSIAKRNVVHSRISGLIDSVASSGKAAGVGLPELGATASVSCEPGDPLTGLSRITMLHHTLDAPPGYLDSFEQKVARVIDEKASQARKDGWSETTVLLIDVSTARFGQLMGLGGLQAWFDQIPIEWEDVPYAGVAIAYTHLYGFSINGICRLRPSLSEAQLDLTSSAMTGFGLAVVQDCQVAPTHEDLPGEDGQ